MSSDSLNKPHKGSTQQRRQLRERKQRKLYLDEFLLGDDEPETVRGFSVSQKLESSAFAHGSMVREIRGEDLTVAYLQRHGFNTPLLCHDKSGLGLRMPNAAEFTVNDVRLCVGSRRTVDVMDVNTQKNLQMTMKDWQQYYENVEKNRLLNVISLEFSHTRLDQYVQSPEIVRQIDWVDVVWPKQLKDAQKESTNLLGRMMYPKVQKYCLMSVAHCYTDFHIDFGGTSVWYHILKGSKVFWLIPPSERNLKLYEKWVLSGKQADVFFGDIVEKCARIYLKAGDTFFIPSGWIHAVYTPTESLVFGGNFLHSFGMEKQLCTAVVEDNTKVPQKFRYPFFTEMLWYVLARYAYRILGRSHLAIEESVPVEEMQKRERVYLTTFELHGLKEILYLHRLPPQRKSFPDMLRSALELIRDIGLIVQNHHKDDPELAITGIHVLQPQTDITTTYQVYDRMRVKAEIKQEMAAKNAEIIREQKRMDAEAAAARAEHAANNHQQHSFNNGVIQKSEINTVKAESNAEIAVTAEIKPTTDVKFISPADNMKYRPPKKMHLANAVAAAAYQINNAGNASNLNNDEVPISDLNHKTHFRSGNAPNAPNAVSVIASSSSYYNTHGNQNAQEQKLQSQQQEQQQQQQHRQQDMHTSYATHTNQIENGFSLNANSTCGTGQPRRRRTRCKVCAACQRSDCGECSFCLDMVKFGGPGRAKQTCMMRQCLAPMLPVTAQCVYCHLDGWRQTPVLPQTKQLANIDGPSSLMECSVCYEISHPECALSQLDGTEDADEAKGIVNEDLPNSWECPSCCLSGKNNDYKPRHFRARLKSSEVRRTSSATTDSLEAGNSQINQYDFVFTSESEVETGQAAGTLHWKQNLKRYHHQLQMLEGKLERSSSTTSPGGSPTRTDKTKRRKSDDGTSMCSSVTESLDASVSMDYSACGSFNQGNGGQNYRKKNSARSQLAQKMISTSSRVLKKPQYVVRPANTGYNGGTANSTHFGANLAIDATVLKIFFRYLTQETLVTCSLVCKSWSNASVDPDLWKTMNCAQQKISASLLMAIVRRQPEYLILDWTQIAKRQLTWLIARLPALRHLSLQNCPIQAALALHTCNCPPLQILDLSFVRGLNDSAIREILSAPKDARPGLIDSKTRLRDLKTFKLAGTDISDVSVRYITQSLTHLQKLDLSSCQRITDAGVAQIGTSLNATANLRELNLSACRLVTESALDYLSKCKNLIWLDLRHVPQVSTQSVIKFASNSQHNLCVKDVKLVERRYATSNSHQLVT